MATTYTNESKSAEPTFTNEELGNPPAKFGKAKFGKSRFGKGKAGDGLKYSNEVKNETTYTNEPKN